MTLQAIVGLDKPRQVLPLEAHPGLPPSMWLLVVFFIIGSVVLGVMDNLETFVLAMTTEMVQRGAPAAAG
jgi:hypothetical protein